MNATIRSVRLLGAATPVNAEAEIERLTAALAGGRPSLPRWEYRKLDVASATSPLGSAARALRARGALGELVRARALELRLEAAMAEAIGTRAFGELALERFRQPARAARAADKTAAAWTGARARDRGPLVRSDSDDPRSLLSQVRAAVGRHRAPFAVRVTGAISTLAATGERTVYVASGRPVSERAARRIALHEVLGHVLPRVRAAGAHPIFALGTARGTDDQEGLALVYEERAGLLDDARKAELALRHLAARAMQRGADFVEVLRMLLALGAEPREAVVIASRAFRGSDGRFPGLGRESVYITSFSRVRAELRRDPDAERLLACGQVAVAALPALRHGSQHARPEPPPKSAML